MSATPQELSRLHRTLTRHHRCRTAWNAVDRQLYVGFTQDEMDMLADLFSRMDENLTRPETETKG